MMLAGRSFQGVGSGIILTLTEIILSDLVTLAERKPPVAHSSLLRVTQADRSVWNTGGGYQGLSLRRLWPRPVLGVLLTTVC